MTSRPPRSALSSRTLLTHLLLASTLVVTPPAPAEPPASTTSSERLPPGQQRPPRDASTRPVPKDSSAPAAARAPETSPAAPPTPPTPPGRRLRDRPRPTLRLGFGGAYAPRSAPVAGAARTTGGLSIDLALGASVEVHKHVFLWPELGYSYSVREGHAGHFFTAGLAPMFGTPLAQVGLAPRLVTGDAWGATGVGLRSGLVGSFGLNLLSVELGHQWLRAGGRDLHDGRFMISVDLVTVAKAVVVLAVARAIFR